MPTLLRKESGLPQGTRAPLGSSSPTTAAPQVLGAGVLISLVSVCPPRNRSGSFCRVILTGMSAAPSGGIFLPRTPLSGGARVLGGGQRNLPPGFQVPLSGQSLTLRSRVPSRWWVQGGFYSTETDARGPRIIQDENGHKGYD